MEDKSKDRRLPREEEGKEKKEYRPPKVHSRKAREQKALQTCDLTAVEGCAAPGA